MVDGQQRARLAMFEGAGADKSRRRGESKMGNSSSE